MKHWAKFWDSFGGIGFFLIFLNDESVKIQH